MVFVTFLKVHGPVSGLMTWESCVQEVMRRIRQGSHRCFGA